MSGQELWLVRHGQTEWSAAGRHTSRTDLDLTSEGEREALSVKPLLQGVKFNLVLSSPMRRAARTAELAGFSPEPDPDLVEWGYGDFEGLTTDQIREQYPGWTIWDGPWPNGDQPEDVAARTDRVIGRALALPPGSSALVFAHGHILRVLAARWLGRPPSDGKLLLLGTATLSTLGWEHGARVVAHWNVPSTPLGRKER